MSALVTEHLPLLAGAPNGIEKLRELILELAVRGQLVPQDASDEPASELLKRITAERPQKNRPSKTLAEIDDDDKPFSPALGWALIRLGYAGEWAVGSGFPTQEQGLTDQPILFCKVSDMNLSGNEKFIRDTKNSIDEAAAARLRVNVHQAGTVVFPKIGGAIATHKRRVLVRPTAIDNNCLGLAPNGTLSSDYLYLLLSSFDLTEFQVGTSVPALSQGVLSDIIVGLPPINEQHRIVAKVDELMVLCDRLEARQTDAESAHAQLVEALLGSLTQARDANDFATCWQRLSQHFHTLFTTESSIDALKQAVLQLAVMGKLVPQDESEESANVLLKRIAQEKSLHSARRAKVQEAMAGPNLAQEPFALPAGWSWSRLAGIATKITDGTHHTPTYVESGVPFLSVKDMSSGVLNFRSTRFISQEEHGQLIKRCNPEFGDLLLTKVGTTGIPVVVNTKDPFSIFVSVALIKAPWHLIDVEYLKILISSPFVKAQSDGGTEGIGNKNLVLRKIADFLLVIPPKDEQHRIVAKVDQLMALCDQLKSRLIQAHQLNEQLATTLVDRAVA